MQSSSASRILCNRDNLAREATITASAQRASDDIRLEAQARRGGGRMALSGPYLGAEDGVIDVEVLSGTGGELVASMPVVRGVGSGALTVESVDVTAVPDTVTFALVDKGTPPVPAQLEFYGVTLAARTPGLVGNALSVTVTRNVVATPTSYATLEPISAGTPQLEGAQWDWAQPAAVDAGIPPGALRVQFEGFPVVHRAWKVWDQGRFVFRLDPVPPYDIPANTRVLAVSGDYTLTLSDGVQSEVFAGVVTVYDFLVAVDTRSTLAEVRGVVARDTAPGGMAVTEMPLRTDAHHLPPSGGQVVVHGVSPSAPTENLVLEYLGAAAPGRWRVSGSVSGVLPQAATGTLYAHGPVSFTVQALASASLGARIDARARFAPRSDGEALPAVCFKPVMLGVSAVDKTVTFKWTRRPKSNCRCDNLPALRLPALCLGLEPDGGGMMLEPEYQSRLQGLYQWRAAFAAANTSTGPDAVAVVQDLDMADQVVALFARTLAEVHGDTGARDLWDAYRVTMQSELATLHGVAGYLPAPEGAGDSTELTAWRAIVAAATTIQGGAKGSVYYNAANQRYYRLELSQVEFSPAVSVGYPWEQPTAGLVLPFGYYYETTTGVVPTEWESRTFEPFADAGWATSASHMLERAVPLSASRGGQLRVRLWYTDLGAPPAGLTGSTDDGPQHNLKVDSPEQLVRRYSAQMDHVLTAAGIVPKSDASNNTVAGDGCWRDPGHDFWWVDESGEYLPIFNNTPYVSAVVRDGVPVSTREWGVGVVTQCEHRLREGDEITIRIRGTGQSLQAGDRIVIPVVAAAAAAFGGGDAGDDTQRWSVRSAVLGVLPDWLRSPGDGAPHSAGALTVRLADGALPWEVGDTIRVELEGGCLRWRRDGGTWVEADIFGPALDLGDGLLLDAAPGAAPSFAAGDSWQFRALATHGVSRLRQPRVGRGFAWLGDTVTLDLDLGALHDVECVMLGLHTLPAGARVDVWDPDDPSWEVFLDAREGPLLAMLPAGTRVRYLKVRVTHAGAGAAIGWLFVGRGWRPSVGASALTMQRQYGLARGQGLNPAALYRGRGTGGRWQWDIDRGAALLGANADELVDLVDYVARNGLEPVCLVPDVRDPGRAALAILDADELALSELSEWQASGVAQAVVSVDLPFRAVLS
ncbi:hypothetical protein ACFQ4M_15965 [Thauera mechernichensis]|uniref:Uncharacterized protein n=1 Tax=Thauera mechernichensis TaxID=82788 RepID=A0ABW3WJC4_9RHOO|nr:hypothetical protein [Thauera mechernichensis]MDG3063249.1 hypothetical protein [Thauera mechernichensis]